MKAVTVPDIFALVQIIIWTGERDRVLLPPSSMLPPLVTLLSCIQQQALTSVPVQLREWSTHGACAASNFAGTPHDWGGAPSMATFGTLQQPGPGSKPGPGILDHPVLASTACWLLAITRVHVPRHHPHLTHTCRASMRMLSRHWSVSHLLVGCTRSARSWA